MRLWMFLALALGLGDAGAVNAGTYDDVELRSIYARNYRFEKVLGKDAKASVFVFMRPGCPAVELAAPALTKLWQDYRAKGVNLYAVYSFSGVNIRSMAISAQKMELPLRAFLDVNQGLAKAWGVKRTAEAVLVGSDGKIHYKGAVLEGDRNGSDADFYLKEALDQYLAGDTVKVAQTAGQGCLINTAPTRNRKGMTFHKDILPILQAKCQRCHRPGEVAPMELMTYEDVSSYGGQLAQVVEDRVMPPWPVESPLKLKDDAALTDEEVRKILGWVEEEMPEGNPADAPKPVEWLAPDAWELGTPDVVLKSRQYTIPARGTVPYIYTRHPLNNTNEDVFLEGLEVKPGARRVVHHMAIHEFPYSENPLTAVDLIKIYGLEISNTILGAYVPGLRPRIVPPGHGIRLKKGMGILIDAHYTPYGKQETDVTQVGLRFTKKPPEREIFTKWFYRSRGRFMIPKQTEHLQMVRDDISFDQDIEIMGMRPHMHARGKSFLVEKMVYDGVSAPGTEKTEMLLSLPRWDFNWQYDYMLEKPLLLKGGESLRITGVWDNTAFNPTNPDPNIDVLFGEQTEHEMMGVLLIWRNALKNEVTR